MVERNLSNYHHPNIIQDGSNRRVITIITNLLQVSETWNTH